MGRLFISYRRDDTQDITDHLYEKLAARFGKANIFMDVDSIPPGADFRKILHEAVAGCDVALVMIGRQWLTVRDANGARRLDNPSDFVRIEIEAALAREIPVVPILTQGIAMVRESDLPPSMSELAYRHAEEVRSGQHFNADAERLIGRLTQLLSAPARRDAPQPAPVAPPPTPRYPPPDVPARLAGLGFRGVNINGTPAIVPPLITIPAGWFMMGSDKSKDSQAFDREMPQHRVEVAAFQIARHPVTVAEYSLAVNHGTVRKPPDSGNATWAMQQQRPDHPVVCVSWQDATAYITWLVSATGQPGWQLPTEAEWEKAARWDLQSNSSRINPWGDTFDQNRCNTSESGIGTTSPVGSYPANDARRSGASPYGVEEMTGNVWEWTDSLYKDYPYIQNDGREDQQSAENRALRGGSWRVSARSARVAYRSVSAPDDLNGGTGFRLAHRASSLAGQAPGE